jgi:hypothetical protein
MVNSGGFLNEFVANLLVFWPLLVGVVIGLPIFGYFYNKLMDSLGDNEHTSIYVAGGILITIMVAALFSWKSALLFLFLFTLNGIPMIVGDYLRGKKKAKQPRRKRMPYAANGLIDEAGMAGEEANRLLGAALKKRENREEMLALVSLASQELTTLRLRLAEVKQIQKDK